MRKSLEILQHILEFLIIFVMITGGIAVLFADPINTGGPVATFFGAQSALYFYGGLFAIEGVLLAYSKFMRRKKLHKDVLMAVYLTMIFVTILETLLTGWSLALLDNVVVGLVAAYCWLRWKFLTEYLSPIEIAKLRVESKDLGRKE